MVMVNKKCMRCGYNEFVGSLHKHHIDLNHGNDDPDNIILLCSNCHFSLHHNKWEIREIGIINIKTPIPPVKKTRKPGLRYINIKLLNDIKHLEHEIKELEMDNITLSKALDDKERLYHQYNELRNIEKTIISDYILYNSYNLYDDIVLIEATVSAIRFRLHNTTKSKNDYIPPHLSEFIKKYYSKIRQHEQSSLKHRLTGDTIAVIQEHYRTPSTAEMSEVARDKPII